MDTVIQNKKIKKIIKNNKQKIFIILHSMMLMLNNINHLFVKEIQYIHIIVLLAIHKKNKKEIMNKYYNSY